MSLSNQVNQLGGELRALAMSQPAASNQKAEMAEWYKNVSEVISSLSGVSVEKQSGYRLQARYQLLLSCSVLFAAAACASASVVCCFLRRLVLLLLSPRLLADAAGADQIRLRSLYAAGSKQRAVVHTVVAEFSERTGKMASVIVAPVAAANTMSSAVAAAQSVPVDDIVAHAVEQNSLTFLLRELRARCSNYCSLIAECEMLGKCASLGVAGR